MLTQRSVSVGYLFNIAADGFQKAAVRVNGVYVKLVYFASCNSHHIIRTTYIPNRTSVAQGDLTFYIENGILCVLIRIDEAILMRTHKIPSC